MTSRFEIYKAYKKAADEAERAERLKKETENGRVSVVKGQKVVQPSREK